MKKSLSIMALLLAFTLVIAGCGTAKPATSSSSSASTQTSSSATPNPGTSSTPTPDNSSLSPEEIATKANTERYATLANPNITIFGKEAGADASQDAKIELFEKKYGGKVTVITENDNPENAYKAVTVGQAPHLVGLSNNRLYIY